MHWAGRIEKELDKVLQHVTGTQQMRSVSPRQRCVRRTMFTCIINQPGFTGQVTQLCVCVCVCVCVCSCTCYVQVLHSIRNVRTYFRSDSSQLQRPVRGLKLVLRLY